jgi:hypothetical protein
MGKTGDIVFIVNLVRFTILISFLPFCIPGTDSAEFAGRRNRLQ